MQRVWTPADDALTDAQERAVIAGLRHCDQAHGRPVPFPTIFRATVDGVPVLVKRALRSGRITAVSAA